MSAISELKAAALDCLLANAAIADAVGKRIFDYPPSDQRGNERDPAFPYIYLGAVTFVYLEAGADSDASTVRLRFHCATAAPSRDQPFDVLALVRSALKDQEFALTNASMTPLRPVAGGDVIDRVALPETYMDFDTTVITG